MEKNPKNQVFEMLTTLLAKHDHTQLAACLTRTDVKIPNASLIRRLKQQSSDKSEWHWKGDISATNILYLLHSITLKRPPTLQLADQTPVLELNTANHTGAP